MSFFQPTRWERVKNRFGTALDLLRWLGLVLLLLGGLALVVVVAWTSMNLGTFLLFALLVVLIVAHEWRHYKVLDDVLAIVEKRLWALEWHAGLGEAWLVELESARKARRAMGGPVSEHVEWPWDEDRLNHLQWTRWNEWKAKYDAVMKERPTGATHGQKEYTDWEEEKYDPVMEQRPSWVPKDYGDLIRPDDDVI